MGQAQSSASAGSGGDTASRPKLQGKSFRQRMQTKLRKPKPSTRGKPTARPMRRKKGRGHHRHSVAPVLTSSAAPKRRGSVGSLATSDGTHSASPSGYSTPSISFNLRKRQGRRSQAIGAPGQFLANQVRQIIGPIDRYALEANWQRVLGHSNAPLTLEKFKMILRQDDLSDEFIVLLFRSLKHIPAVLDPRFLPGYQQAMGQKDGQSASVRGSRRGSLADTPLARSPIGGRSRRPSLDVTANQGHPNVTLASELTESYSMEPLTLSEFLIAYGVYRQYLTKPSLLPSPAVDPWDTTGLLIWKSLMPNVAPLFNRPDEMARFLAELDGQSLPKNTPSFRTMDWCLYLEGCAALLQCIPQCWSEYDDTADPASPAAHNSNLVIRRLWQGLLRLSDPKYTSLEDTLTVPMDLGATFMQRLGEGWLVVVGEYLYHKFFGLAMLPFRLQNSPALPSQSNDEPDRRMSVASVPRGESLNPLKTLLLPTLDTRSGMTTPGVGSTNAPDAFSHHEAHPPMLDDTTLWCLTWSVPAELVFNSGGPGTASNNTGGAVTTPPPAHGLMLGTRSGPTSRRGSMFMTLAAGHTMSPLAADSEGPGTPGLLSPAAVPPASMPGSRRGSTLLSSPFNCGDPLLGTAKPTMTWHRLYLGSEHGYSMVQFQKHVFKYPCPTLLVVKAETTDMRGLAANQLFKDCLNSTPPTAPGQKQSVVFAVYVDQPWKYSRSYWGQTHCAMIACAPVFHRFPTTQKVGTSQAKSKLLYNPAGTDSAGLSPRTPAATLNESGAQASPFTGIRPGASRHRSSSLTSAIPEKYQSVFTPPDQAQYERGPDQRYIYCHPNIGIGVGGLTSISAQTLRSGNLGGKGPGAGGSVTHQLQGLSLQSHSSAESHFTLHIDNHFRKLTWCNDPFRLSHPSRKFDTSSSATASSAATIKTGVSALPFVPVDTTQDFTLSMDIVDLEVYGLGGEIALMVQQKAWETEQKEQNKPSRLMALSNAATSGDGESGSGGQPGTDSSDPYRALNRQILEWAGIINADRSEV
ncbi:Restriction of telomere capping protein 5 [Dimargaris verticillata]|uniref:Restriction of telomere capping protein 5 n=1 Tax=Dimargaris verticillata TaxID=2761393 RepID=A0A9W8E7Q7_9FUNG|nr:Restriction of telomere capping protein 5 [Dimargaris verticillata]